MRSIEHSGVIAGFSLAAAAALGATGCASEAAPTQEPTVSTSAKQPGEMTLDEELRSAYKSCNIRYVGNVGRSSLEFPLNKQERVAYDISLDAPFNLDTANNPGPSYNYIEPKARTKEGYPVPVRFKDGLIYDNGEDDSTEIRDMSVKENNVLKTVVASANLRTLRDLGGREEVSVYVGAEGQENLDNGQPVWKKSWLYCGRVAVTGGLDEGITVALLPREPDLLHQVALLEEVDAG